MRRAVQFLLETTKHKAPFARRKRKHSFPYVTLPEAIQPTYPSPPLFLNVVHDTLAWMVALRLRKTTGPSTPQDFQWRDSASSTSCVKLNRATPSSDFSSTPVGDKSAHGCYFGRVSALALSASCGLLFQELVVPVPPKLRPSMAGTAVAG